MLTIPSLQGSVSPEEWQLRCDLAACYRLVALYGWSDLVFTHISAKLPESVSGAGDCQAGYTGVHFWGSGFAKLIAATACCISAGARFDANY